MTREKQALALLPLLEQAIQDAGQRIESPDPRFYAQQPNSIGRQVYLNGSQRIVYTDGSAFFVQAVIHQQMPAIFTTADSLTVALRKMR